ncbi:unnamed protein product, partial [marine sediment metagenome]
MKYLVKVRLVAVAILFAISSMAYGAITVVARP